MPRWKQATAVLLSAVLCALLNSSADGRANRLGQARTHVQSIVARVAIGHVIGAHVDLPYTLRPCPDEAQKRASNEALQDLIKGTWYDRHYANRAPLCRPFVGEFARVGDTDGRMTFQLPQDRCPEIQATVARALNDLRGDVYRNLWDHAVQSRVGTIFGGISYGVNDRERHHFPSTGWPTGRYYDFTVENCLPHGGATTMTIIMRKR